VPASSGVAIGGGQGWAKSRKPPSIGVPSSRQIWGCELHENAFGGRAPLGPAEGAIVLPRLPSRYKGRGRGEEKMLGIGREEKGEGKDVKG